MEGIEMIENWKNRKPKRVKAQTAFVKRLKAKKGKPLDLLANKTHDEVFEKIDCLDCANCCTSIPPIVNRADSSRIAKYLGLKVAAFEEEYLRIDEDGDKVINASPCPFLETDNACSIYDVRPRACQEYPHTDAQTFSQNLHLHATNAHYCPAVFHILEKMDSVLSFKKK